MAWHTYSSTVTMEAAGSSQKWKSYTRLHGVTNHKMVINGSRGANLKYHKYFSRFMSLPPQKMTTLDLQAGEQSIVRVPVHQYKKKGMGIWGPHGGGHTVPTDRKTPPLPRTSPSIDNYIHYSTPAYLGARSCSPLLNSHQDTRCSILDDNFRIWNNPQKLVKAPRVVHTTALRMDFPFCWVPCAYLM